MNLLRAEIAAVGAALALVAGLVIGWVASDYLYVVPLEMEKLAAQRDAAAASAVYRNLEKETNGALQTLANQYATVQRSADKWWVQWAAERKERRAMSGISGASGAEVGDRRDGVEGSVGADGGVLQAEQLEADLHAALERGEALERRARACKEAMDRLAAAMDAAKKKPPGE